MGIGRPIIPPLYRQANRPRDGSLPWDRGIGGGGAVLGAPGEPTISGTVEIGSTLTIAAGGGGAPTSYRKLLGGVDQGAVVNGYTFTADDIGPTITVIARNAAGDSAASNTLRLESLLDLSAPPDAFYDRSGLTLVSTTHVSAQADGSGNGHTSMSQGTDANRPRYADDGSAYIGGVPAIRYDGAGYWMAGPTIANLLSDASQYWMLVPIRYTGTGIIAATDTTIFNGQCVVGSDGRHLLLALYSVSSVNQAGFWATTTTLKAADDPCAVGSRLIRCRKNGTTVGVVVDGATEATDNTNDVNIGPTSEVIRFGYSGFGGLFNGTLGDVPIWNTPPSANVQATAAALVSFQYSLPESPWS